MMLHWIIGNRKFSQHINHRHLSSETVNGQKQPHPSTILKCKYENLIDGKMPVESHLHECLAEHLNSEIALNTINNLEVAMQWMRSTFLYVRSVRNPIKYGFEENLSKELVERKLEEMCYKQIKSLNEANMITMDITNGLSMQTTPYGKLMARYYICFETMKLFRQIRGDETYLEMFNLIIRCKEFAEFSLRNNEKKYLNELNVSPIRFPIPGRIKTNADKVSCLIQATLGNSIISSAGLSQEASKMLRIGDRVSKCLLEYMRLTENQLHDFRSGCYKALLYAITIAKCFHAKLWENSEYASKQLHKIGAVYSRLLASSGKTTLKSLAQTEAATIELILKKQYPFGNEVLQNLMSFPEYSLEVNLKFENMLHVIIKQVNECYKFQGGGAVLIIGDSQNNLLLNVENIENNIYEFGYFERNIKINNLEVEFINVHIIHMTLVGVDTFAKVLLGKANRSEDDFVEEAAKKGASKRKQKAQKTKIVNSKRSKFDLEELALSRESFSSAAALVPKTNATAKCQQLTSWLRGNNSVLTTDTSMDYSFGDKPSTSAGTYSAKLQQMRFTKPKISAHNIVVENSFNKTKSLQTPKSKQTDVEPPNEHTKNSTGNSILLDELHQTTIDSLYEQPKQLHQTTIESFLKRLHQTSIDSLYEQIENSTTNGHVKNQLKDKSSESETQKLHSKSSKFSSVEHVASILDSDSDLEEDLNKNYDSIILASLAEQSKDSAKSSSAEKSSSARESPSSQNQTKNSTQNQPKDLSNFELNRGQLENLEKNSIAQNHLPREEITTNTESVLRQTLKLPPAQYSAVDNQLTSKTTEYQFSQSKPLAYRPTIHKGFEAFSNHLKNLKKVRNMKSFSSQSLQLSKNVHCNAITQNQNTNTTNFSSYLDQSQRSVHNSIVLTKNTQNNSSVEESLQSNTNHAFISENTSNVESALSQSFRLPRRSTKYCEQKSSIENQHNSTVEKSFECFSKQQTTSEKTANVESLHGQTNNLAENTITANEVNDPKNVQPHHGQTKDLENNSTGLESISNHTKNLQKTANAKFAINQRFRLSLDQSHNFAHNSTIESLANSTAEKSFECYSIQQNNSTKTANVESLNGQTNNPPDQVNNPNNFELENNSTVESFSYHSRNLEKSQNIVSALGDTFGELPPNQTDYFAQNATAEKQSKSKNFFQSKNSEKHSTFEKSFECFSKQQTTSEKTANVESLHGQTNNLAENTITPNEVNDPKNVQPHHGQTKDLENNSTGLESISNHTKNLQKTANAKFAINQRFRLSLDQSHNFAHNSSIENLVNSTAEKSFECYSIQQNKSTKTANDESLHGQTNNTPDQVNNPNNFELENYSTVDSFSYHSRNLEKSQNIVSALGDTFGELPPNQTDYFAQNATAEKQSKSKNVFQSKSSEKHSTFEKSFDLFSNQSKYSKNTVNAEYELSQRLRQPPRPSKYFEQNSTIENHAKSSIKNSEKHSTAEKRFEQFSNQPKNSEKTVKTYSYSPQGFDLSSAQGLTVQNQSNAADFKSASTNSAKNSTVHSKNSKNNSIMQEGFESFYYNAESSFKLPTHAQNFNQYRDTNCQYLSSQSKDTDEPSTMLNGCESFYNQPKKLKQTANSESVVGHSFKLPSAQIKNIPKTSLTKNKPDAKNIASSNNQLKNFDNNSKLQSHFTSSFKQPKSLEKTATADFPKGDYFFEFPATPKKVLQNGLSAQKRFECFSNQSAIRSAKTLALENQFTSSAANTSVGEEFNELSCQLFGADLDEASVFITKNPVASSDNPSQQLNNSFTTASKQNENSFKFPPGQVNKPARSSTIDNQFNEFFFDFPATPARDKLNETNHRFPLDQAYNSAGNSRVGNQRFELNLDLAFSQPKSSIFNITIAKKTHENNLEFPAVQSVSKYIDMDVNTDVSKKQDVISKIDQNFLPNDFNDHILENSSSADDEDLESLILLLNNLEKDSSFTKKHDKYAGNIPLDATENSVTEMTFNADRAVLEPLDLSRYMNLPNIYHGHASPKSAECCTPYDLSVAGQNREGALLVSSLQNDVSKSLAQNYNLQIFNSDSENEKLHWYRTTTSKANLKKPLTKSCGTQAMREDINITSTTSNSYHPEVYCHIGYLAYRHLMKLKPNHWNYSNYKKLYQHFERIQNQQHLDAKLLKSAHSKDGQNQLDVSVPLKDMHNISTTPVSSEPSFIVDHKVSNADRYRLRLFPNELNRKAVNTINQEIMDYVLGQKCIENMELDRLSTPSELLKACNAILKQSNTY